jgi:hypothetical protein
MRDKLGETRDMPQGRKTSPAVRKEITRLALEGWGPAEIERELDRNPALRGEVPDRRTIQRHAKRVRPPDTSRAWALLGADPEDAALILDVVCYVFDLSEGRVWLTQDEAAWVLRVEIAAPSIPPRWAWWLATTYRLLADEAEPETRALDVTLGVEPWLSEDHAKEWAALLRRRNLLDEEETDERVIETLSILADLEGWPSLVQVGEVPSTDDTRPWYEPGPDNADQWQGPAPATAPPEGPDDAL